MLDKGHVVRHLFKVENLWKKLSEHGFLLVRIVILQVVAEVDVILQRPAVKSLGVLGY